eukprot:g14844.t1
MLVLLSQKRGSCASAQDDKAKVRRLDQALETPCVRYERAATPRLFQVSHEAQQVRRHLAKEGVMGFWTGFASLQFLS